MFSSMRSMGYDLNSAVADLVDNSLTARAEHIDITFHWKGADSAIAIVDDGLGMSEKRLREAMAPVSQHPSEERDERDLGRFGLGLKTASLSQARLLSVVTKMDGGQPHARHWDMDYVEEVQDWLLCLGLPPDTDCYLERFSNAHQGTAVILQQLDRLLDLDREQTDADRDFFLAKTASVGKHLGLVFHRFLSAPNPIRMTVNGVPVEPWDPFMSSHQKTQWLAEEVISIEQGDVVVQPFVLPHHSHLSSDEHTEGGGEYGWNAAQGFYVYRNRRLIVAGDYLGLRFKQEPHYSLVRIKVDLPNTMDSAWQIDVKKATAKPPDALKAELTRIARLTRQEGEKVYRHRGKIVRRQSQEADASIWDIKKKGDRRYYVINRAHPAIKAALATDARPPDFRRALAVIERGMPWDHAVLQHQARPGEWLTAAELADHRDVMESGVQFYRALVEAGIPPLQARDRVVSTEPYGDNTALIARLDELVREAS